MEVLVFALPSLLVAVAYLAPWTGAEHKTTGAPLFRPLGPCRR